MTDGFISTDIDKIINILKKQKKLSLNDLAKESGISSSLLEKWLPILEEEGLIDISYHLTRVYISWIGDEVDNTSSNLKKETEIPIDVYPEQFEYPISRDIELPDEEEKVKEDQTLKKTPSSAKTKKQIEQPLEEFKVPEELNSDYNDYLKKHVTSPSTNIKKIYPESKTSKEVSQISIKPKASDKGIDVKPFDFSVEEPRKTKLDERAQKIRNYMEEINKARDELEKLKIEKTKLFRETYEPIEKKFSAELENISDKIYEKEERILQLQQKVLLLPNVIDEVDRQQLKLKEIEEEARKTFDDASIVINESLGDLSELEVQATEQIKIAKESINLGVDESEEMNNVLTKIGNLEFEVRDKLNTAKQRLEDEQKKINSLEISLQKLESIRTKATDKVEQVEELVGSQKRRIADLEREVSKIGEIQKWVSKHKEEYGLLIDEFGEQIKMNELEYNNLREAIETNFVKKYIEDLGQVSKGYEFELDQAKQAEKNIDEKIDLTKQRISELLEKSREIIDAFEYGEKEAPSEINVQRIQDKERNLLQRIESKEEERKQILDVLKDMGSNQPTDLTKQIKEQIKPKDINAQTSKSKEIKKEKKEKIMTYSEFLSAKRSEGLSMKQISNAWKKYKKEKGI
ncbi:MAG: winged helix-turn-helix transcriptional regulator [Candidatus Micrarchaeia archaeon]